MDSVLRQAHLDHLTQSARSPADHPQEVPPELLTDKHVQEGVEAAVRVGDCLAHLQSQFDGFAGLASRVVAS